MKVALILIIFISSMTVVSAQENDVNFTGHAQDLVQGTYDTLSRELNANQGRWISPDPAHSSWNAYAYTTNPLIITDSTGNGDDDEYELYFGGFDFLSDQFFQTPIDNPNSPLCMLQCESGASSGGSLIADEGIPLYTQYGDFPAPVASIIMSTTGAGNLIQGFGVPIPRSWQNTDISPVWLDFGEGGISGVRGVARRAAGVTSSIEGQTYAAGVMKRGGWAASYRAALIDTHWSSTTAAMPNSLAAFNRMMTSGGAESQIEIMMRIARLADEGSVSGASKAFRDIIAGDIPSYAASKSLPLRTLLNEEGFNIGRPKDMAILNEMAHEGKVSIFIWYAVKK
jgi:RHS repeat-associated protein